MTALAHLEAGPPDGPLVCCVHGFPQSGRMWEPVLEACAALGIRAIAPDLPGYGRSPARRPATWAMHVSALDEFLADRGPVALVVHDWGGLIGLRWACDHPDRVTALIISDTGFFHDGRWHGLAEQLRSNKGEDVVASFTRENMSQLMRSISAAMDDAAIDEYCSVFEGADAREAALELYRSGDFQELAPYQGRLAALGVPTLLLWGADDQFAPVAGAHRLAREIPHAQVRVLADTGHFVVDEAPAAYSGAVAGFLAGALLPH